MRINLYAQNRNSMVLDGVPLSNFGEGDYMTIKLDGGGASRSHGGDGPQMNQAVAQGGQITVTLLPTSPALGLMYEIRNAQIKAPRMFGVVLTTGVDEMLIASGCAFGELAQFATGGPTMQPRQFVIEALHIKLDISEVETVAGGFIGA
jgi:hypothetical protein